MSSPGLAVSCYGKLPFHPEYLRIGLESPGAIGAVRWVDGAHGALSAGKHGEPGRTLVRFAMRGEDKRGVVAGVVRQSTDGGGRRHPICLFVEAPLGAAEERWHLLPLALADTWTLLADLLERPIRSMDDLKTVVATPVPGPDLAGVEAEHETWMGQSEADGPWARLTQARGDAARNLAANFLTVAEAERDARRVEEGVAFVVALPAADGRHPAAAWLDLFAAAVRKGAAPTIALRTDEGGATRLCAVYRPAEGEDLAALLARPETAPLDDLNETWGVDAPAGGALDALLAAPGALADLRARLRSAT